MAVMPHKDVDRALELSLSLDVPYWPQLPKVSYYEEPSLLSPATCCLVNVDAEETVEKAFQMVKNLSARLREKFKLT
jgi:hypothetical protein